METIVNSEAAVTSVVVLVVDSSLRHRAAESLLLAVLVDAPEVVDAFVDGLLVQVPAQHGGGHREESDVLNPQLEHGYIKYRRMLVGLHRIGEE